MKDTGDVFVAMGGEHLLNEEALMTVAMTLNDNDTADGYSALHGTLITSIDFLSRCSFMYLDRDRWGNGE
jgi:hypothetical protein